MAKNIITIGFAALQANKENGNEFVSVKGTTVIEDQMLDAEVLVDAKSIGDFARLRKIAEKFQAAEEAGDDSQYPRGLALEAPNGFSLDTDQERKPYVVKKGKLAGTEKLSNWVVRVIRSMDPATPSLRIVPAPELKLEVSPEADAIMAKYGC